MKNNSYRKLYFCLILIAILFTLKEIIGFNIGGLLLVGIISVLTLSIPYTQAKAFVFFILPFTSSISGLTVLCMYGILLLKSHQKCIWQFLPAVLIALLELFNVAFYPFSVNYESVISYISFISLFFFLLFDKSDETNIILNVKCFCLGVSCVLVLVYASMIIHNGFSELLAGNLRNTIAMGYDDIATAKGRLTMNANTIAYYSIVLFSIFLLGYNRLACSRPLFSAMLFVAVLAGLFSFSRTWLLLASFILIFYIITSKKKIIVIIGGILACCIIIVSQEAIISSIFDVFTNRMNAETMADAGGRIPIFIDYNKFWASKVNYVLFGTGATHYPQIIPHDFSMHCGLQQIWILHGISGVLIFLLAIVHYVNKYIKPHNSIMYCIPFFTCLIFDQSIQFLVPYSLMFPFLPVAYVLQLNNYNEVLYNNSRYRR